MSIKISNNIYIQEDELDIKAIKSQGSGGQNVNKVSTAIHLFFDINRSSLTDYYKDKLRKLKDHHITNDGVIIIKAQKYRTQESNRIDAIDTLCKIIRKSTVTVKKRKPTRPSLNSKTRRLDSKTKHSKNKSLRKKIDKSNY
ncbi:MAG: aminoacyl-tRNA hydrolase [bacterium]|nr:aminoacyl-tRNA hydrolase [bacterium]